MIMMKFKNQSSTLEITIAVVVIASMLALSVIVLVTQEANAAASTKVSIKQTQVNQCSGSAKCIKTSTITFGSGGVHGSPGGGHNSHG
jgi:preprotein translocase subunit SecG